MILNYSLSERDFVQHQLFIASKNTRTKGWLILTGAFLLLGVICYIEKSKLLYQSFFLITIITFIFYPWYAKREAKKHYEKYVREVYFNRFGVKSLIAFDATQIKVSDKTGETKINLSEIIDIIETGEYYYLTIKNGGHLIIPKWINKNYQNLHSELEALAARLLIPYKLDLNWRWK